MAKNSLPPNKNAGDLIRLSDFNAPRISQNKEVVPRDSGGRPKNQGGSLGSPSIRFSETHAKTLNLSNTVRLEKSGNNLKVGESLEITPNSYQFSGDDLSLIKYIERDKVVTSDNIAVFKLLTLKSGEIEAERDQVFTRLEEFFSDHDFRGANTLEVKSMKTQDGKNVLRGDALNISSLGVDLEDDSPLNSIRFSHYFYIPEGYSGAHEFTESYFNRFRSGDTSGFITLQSSDYRFHNTNYLFLILINSSYNFLNNVTIGNQTLEVYSAEISLYATFGNRSILRDVNLTFDLFNIARVNIGPGRS